MQILYLHQYFRTPDMSGGSRSFEMARRFVQNGHEVHLITSSQDVSRASSWYETTEAGIHVHWLPVPYSNHMSYRRRMVAFSQFAMLASHKAASFRPDVIFATSTPLTICVPAVYAARRRRVPMVFEVRDLWPELPIAMGALRNPIAIAAAKSLERFAYENAVAVVALSPGMAKGIERCGTPRSQIHVIPNGCDLDRFGEADLRAKPFLDEHPYLRSKKVVTYAGTLGIINGVDFMVRLAEVIRDRRPDVAFLIVGDGKKRAEIERQAQQSGVLGRNLYMLPPVPKAKMPAVLGATTIATSLFLPEPAMENNSANKFFDALAAGRPLMINYGGWHSDLLASAEAGITVPANDAGTAAARLLTLLDDEAKLSRARTAARSLAEERFSRDRLGSQLLGVLESAASAPSLLETNRRRSPWAPPPRSTST